MPGTTCTIPHLTPQPCLIGWLDRWNGWTGMQHACGLILARAGEFMDGWRHGCIYNMKTHIYA